jgi:hypothetical protein
VRPRCSPNPSSRTARSTTASLLAVRPVIRPTRPVWCAPTPYGTASGGVPGSAPRAAPPSSGAANRAWAGLSVPGTLGCRSRLG